MSEVLSGAEVGNERARIALPPRDERQSLRVARFLMAIGTSLLVCVALAVCAFLGLLPWRASSSTARSARWTGGAVLRAVPAAG
jgi:hypothetical protein